VSTNSEEDSGRQLIGWGSQMLQASCCVGSHSLTGLHANQISLTMKPAIWPCSESLTWVTTGILPRSSAAAYLKPLRRPALPRSGSRSSQEVL
jgi:hypothetical protein